MNVKSRWKSEYLRVTSSSPPGSIISTISETMPEILPEILSEDTTAILNEKAHSSDGTSKYKGATIGDALAENAMTTTVSIATVEVSPSISSTAATTAGIDEEQKGELAVVQKELTPVPRDTETLAATASAPAVTAATVVAVAMEEDTPDPVEQDLLSKLEELRKEKSRLFSLFRAVLQKKEKEAPRPSPAPAESSPQPQEGTGVTPTEKQEEQQQKPVVTNGIEPAAPSAPYPQGTVASGMAVLADVKEETRRPANVRRPSEHDHNKRTEPTRATVKRREHERLIDRSKLNLEIPRKPSTSSLSSSSTASTPTPTSTAFALFQSSSSSSSAMAHKGKRQRSITPTFGNGSTSSSSRGASGAGSFGSGTAMMHGDSFPSNKYPRADYMGSHSRNHSSNSNISSSHVHNNGLPEKPQVRQLHSSTSSSSSSRSISSDGYHHHHYHHHAEDAYHRNKTGGGGPSSSFSNVNSSGSNGAGGGSYRQNVPHPPPPSMGYHPPPTRIGFGNSSGGNSSISSAGSGGGSRSGYYGHGDGGGANSSSGSGLGISKLGHHPPPPSARPLPFNRSMMQMPHARGIMMSRGGFGSGVGRGGGGGGGGGGGVPPERPMASSGRPGDWVRRRSNRA
ncbi:hypothetical protein BC939DRAFT_454239 [Gamsiella multidivaricata]|uniref:uncharacterized protein n=1 Tax=Gamsiella multidivaricata TaxID=101098 RepID=UPI00221F4BD4|nr:uncharacterized protein BC939DRAFT_454239 [Gamsiella multidivaricata]KAI7822192.1 hypothetical protein BC939DRAFT_454239 [Gamsiella multidivaricata]